VFTQYESVGNQKIEDKSVTVTLDPVIQLDMEDISKTSNIFIDAFDRQLIDPETAAIAAEQIITISLQKIGIAASETVFPPEESSEND
jgi:hypothetical protein